MDFQTYTASNGIRFIHLPTQRLAAYCVVIINTGTRDEKEHEQGMAHFLEHVFFKGTEKRKSYHILTRLEDVGGELDAFTTKEDTCIYATFLPPYFERAMELISDILFHSTFPEKELEREKNVIVDEINSYNDSPAELIYDEFEELIFDGHPLAKKILGTESSIRTFTPEIIHQFCDRTYNTDQMAVCTVGNIDFEKVLRLFNKYFSGIPAKKRTWKRKAFKTYIPQEKIVLKNTHQAHCMLGTIAYSFTHKDRLILHLVNNILGGSGSNSRLNMALRERNGIVYFIESSYTTYYDSGVSYIYFGTDKENVDKAIKLINFELKKFCEKPLTKSQLSKAKKQFYGQIAISFENQENLAINLAKSYLVYNQVDDLDKIAKEIEAITSEDILRVANDIFAEEKRSVLKYL
jgi:predicted Zn-dependent peptidase